MKEVLHGGPEPEKAQAVLILIHGRGATAEGMLDLYRHIHRPTTTALAPQAPDGTWYPQSFLAPIDQNQPQLDDALGRIDALVDDLLGRGIDPGKIALLGFSQGACLATEYALRHPRRYGGLMTLTGGFIGPPGDERSDTGSFDGMPAFIGTSDPDPHVPFQRAQETADLLANMGAEIDLRRYPDMPHTICEDEIEACRTLLDKIGAMRD